MAGIKNFVLGFILSLFGVTLLGHLYPSPYQKSPKPVASNIHITLFKKADTSSHPLLKSNLFANVKKQSIALNTIEDELPITPSPEGIEDDEILNIALDDNIPIEFSSSFDEDNKTEVLTEDTEDKSAMLPSELLEDETFEKTPWVVAKGSPYIKNKRLLAELEQPASNNLFTETIQSVENNEKDLSYKVAEKIKQSIIFPIPNEILNDEDLTPTFIHTKKKPSSTSEDKPKVSVKIEKKKEETPKLVIEQEKKSEEKISVAPKPVKDSSILDSISSWFTDKPAVTQDDTPTVKQNTVPVKKKAPSYSSQDRITAKQQQQTEDLAQFYESLQQTRNEHIQRNIASLELKLFFQPGRAEISGKTLNWLKIFSEAALKHNTYLQVRLDGSIDTELQKKRLNLLYTIFMNNGVDFQKIDTVFSLTEPNAFIIRTVKTK